MTISSAASPSWRRSKGASDPPASAGGDDGDGEHHQERHDDAGQDAGHEEGADRDVGHHAVDDEGQRRREDRAEGGGGGGDADGGLDRVAVVLHRLDLDGADAGGVGERGAGHAGEDHRADDVHLRETALHPADEGDGEGVDAPGDAGDVHQVAGEDEEGDGEEREALDAGDHPLRHDDVGGDAGDEEVEAGGDEHGDGDRHADQHQDEEGADEEGHPLTPRCCRRRRGARGWNSRGASSPRATWMARRSISTKAAKTL